MYVKICPCVVHINFYLLLWPSQLSGDSHLQARKSQHKGMRVFIFMTHVANMEWWWWWCCATEQLSNVKKNKVGGGGVVNGMDCHTHVFETPPNPLSLNINRYICHRVVSIVICKIPYMWMYIYIYIYIMMCRRALGVWGDDEFSISESIHPLSFTYFCDDSHMSINLWRRTHFVSIIMRTGHWASK